MIEKCLARKAMDECECEDCKQRREWTKQSIDLMIRSKALEIWMDAMKEAKDEKN
jgi:hypothetical protein